LGCFCQSHDIVLELQGIDITDTRV
jgi:hypothetical protein